MLPPPIPPMRPNACLARTTATPPIHMTATATVDPITIASIPENNEVFMPMILCTPIHLPPAPTKDKARMPTPTKRLTAKKAARARTTPNNKIGLGLGGKQGNKEANTLLT